MKATSRILVTAPLFALIGGCSYGQVYSMTTSLRTSNCEYVSLRERSDCETAANIPYKQYREIRQESLGESSH